MNLRKFLYIIIAAIVMFGIGYPTGADAAKRKSKARTTQTTSKKKRSTSKKGKSTGTKKKKRGGTSKKKRRKSGSSAAAQPKETASNDSLTLLVNGALTAGIAPEINPGGLRVNLVKPDASSHSVKVQLNESFTYLPVSRDLISGFEQTVKTALPDSIADFNISFNVGSRPYSSYISTIDVLPAESRRNVPFVVATNPYVNPRKGMEGDIVALWHSHGRYYRPGSGWAWQRPFLFQTAEDIFTMSFVLPFLTPMLENAGAYVMLPRERDINVHEVIVDNDVNPEGEIYSQTTYKEMNGSKKWQTGEFEGFIYDIPDFRDTENPFDNGTYRQVETVRSGNASVAGWYADIPEDGEYAVYVSYKTLPNSTQDARYTVNYSGGSREFIVNQTMGGGTWIYLGTFPLQAGYSEKVPVVALSNKTEKGGGTVVTADAVKIGGGMGNISRSARRSDVTYGTETAQATMPTTSQPNSGEIAGEQSEVADDDSDEDDSTDDTGDETGEDTVDEDSGDEGDDESDDTSDGEEPAPVAPQPAAPAGPAPRFTTSGLPRFLEGARYWLHWAGFPEEVYSGYNGTDDYKDDFTSRGKWVNYLAGGSRVLPDRPGLHIPVDVSFALHTDAGKRSDDTYVGTLGIYYTDGGRSYADGTPRSNSRILTDMIMRQVVGDVRRTYEPQWTRRAMWDKSYAEARTAEVPSTLLELLSHQNFADMRYGLDPTFRFTVSRAVYKAIGRFVAERKGREFVVQPLPIKAFMIQREKKGTYRLSWQPTPDELEPTAMPSKYIILERTEGALGFRKIGETKSTAFDVKVNDNKIHSFYILAANEGGLSFPSETLALREGTGKTVLIVNGFTRVSGPASFNEGGRAGFLAEEDFGVPYKYDISFGGYQQEFSRNAGDRFGNSGSNHVATVAAGNTFDYPAVHGEAIAAAGHGFVSCSALAVEEGRVKLTDYYAVDLILGKQQLTDVGGASGRRKKLFAAFPAELQTRLADYVSRGGKLIVSGQNVVTDLFADGAPEGSADFARNTLGLADAPVSRSHSGKVKTAVDGMNGEVISYSNTLNKDRYIVEQADILQPAEGAKAKTILTFTDNDDAAGLILERGNGAVAVMSVPFESFTDPAKASRLMKQILEEMK